MNSNERICCVKWSPTNEYIATGHRNGKISLRNPEDGRVVRDLAGHESEIVKLQFTSDGNRLFGVSTDAVPARLWDVATGKLLRTFGTDALPFATISATGRLVVTTTQDDFQLWDGVSGEFLRPIHGGKGAVDISSDDTHVLLQVSHGDAILMNVATETVLHTFHTTEYPNIAVGFSPNGRLTYLRGRQMWVFNALTYQLEVVLAGEDHVNVGDFVDDNLILYIADGKTITLWDTRGQATIHSSDIPQIRADDTIYSASMPSDTSRVVWAWYYSGLVIVFDLCSGREVYRLSP